MKYDACIIGSGLGGLEVALMLAKEGKSVLVLERQSHPGGCMQSYTRSGLSLDTGLHYIGGLEGTGEFPEQFRKLGLAELPWFRMDTSCFEEIHIAGRKFSWSQGIDEFIHGMQKAFPEEREGLDKFRNLLIEENDEFMQSTNAWDYLNSIINDKMLIEVLSAPAFCKMELRKESLPLFTFVHGILPFIKDSWRLRGSGNMLVSHLVSQIEEAGGKIQCNSEVTELVEDNGKICKAVCRNGSTYVADLYISDAHPSVICSLVADGGKMKKTFRQRMVNQENTIGMFTAQLKLKDNSLKYFNHNKILITDLSCWDSYVDSSLNVYNIMVSCHHSQDGNYADNIDILTPMDWSAVDKWADSTLHHRPIDYNRMKEIVAEKCITLASQIIPGLQNMIDGVWTSTPLTYRDYNNTVLGSAFGFRKDYTNTLMTIVSPKTPIQNLLMTGQSLILHGVQGVTMTAGYTIREAIGYFSSMNNNN